MKKKVRLAVAAVVLGGAGVVGMAWPAGATHGGNLNSECRKLTNETRQLLYESAAGTGVNLNPVINELRNASCPDLPVLP